MCLYCCCDHYVLFIQPHNFIYLMGFGSSEGLCHKHWICNLFAITLYFSAAIVVEVMVIRILAFVLLELCWNIYSVEGIYKFANLLCLKLC